MVPLVRLKLLFLVKVPNSDPSVVLVATTSDKLPFSIVERYTSELIWSFDALDERTRRQAIEKVGAVPSSYAQDAVRGGVTQLARSHGALYRVLSNCSFLSQVPPSDLLVLGCCHYDVRVGRPHYRLDATGVNTCADFKACRVAAGQIIYAQLLLHASSRENLRVRLVGKRDGADNVVVSEGVQSFTSMGIPDLAAYG